MNFIILGDKFQKRRKTKGCPGLFKLNKETIIENQYKIIKKFYPTAKIIYTYGFDAKRLLTFIESKDSLKDNITLYYNEFFNTFNYAYSLYIVNQYLKNDDSFILFGDSVIEKQFLKTIDINKGSQVVVNKNKDNTLGCIIDNHLVQNIFYDLDNNIEEIYFLKKQDGQQLAELLSQHRYHNCFIFELMNKLIDSNIKIIANTLNIKSMA